MLGEASTTEIVKTQNPKGFIQNRKAAKQGGAVAGNARRQLESRTGKKVVSTNNYLPEAKQNKKLKKGKWKNQPDKQQKAIDTVLRQAELLADELVMDK